AWAPGFVAKTMWVEVHSGEEKRVAVALEMVGAAKPIETPAKPVEPQSVAPTPGPQRPIDQPTTETHHGRTWTWVAGGAAGVMLLVGIIEGLAFSSDVDEYKKTTDPMRYDQLRNDIPGEGTLANVMFIGAGVAAVGAGFLYWWEGREEGGERV